MEIRKQKRSAESLLALFFEVFSSRPCFLRDFYSKPWRVESTVVILGSRRCFLFSLITWKFENGIFYSLWQAFGCRRYFPFSLMTLKLENINASGNAAVLARSADHRFLLKERKKRDRIANKCACFFQVVRAPGPSAECSFLLSCEQHPHYTRSTGTETTDATTTTTQRTPAADGNPLSPMLLFFDSLDWRLTHMSSGASSTSTCTGNCRTAELHGIFEFVASSSAWQAIL